jgi:hypothetical protein
MLNKFKKYSMKDMADALINLDPKIINNEAA